MIRQFDEKTLSAFFDGELDDIEMQEVDEFIRQNGEAQKYVVNSARITAFLKAASNEILHEKIPEHLIETVRFHRDSRETKNTIVRSLFQVAAAIILIFTGFGVSSMLKNNQIPLPATLAPVLQQYGHIVDAALENNLSGNPHKWSEPRRPTVIMVTPIKTYRDRDSVYYREYRLEIVTETHRQQVNGLAYRAGGGKWITKALFFDDNAATDS